MNAVAIEGALVDRAVKSAVREAVLNHQRLGRAVVGSIGGQIVWVKPKASRRNSPAPSKNEPRRQKAD
jgi:hypothetical protein